MLNRSKVIYGIFTVVFLLQLLPSDAFSTKLWTKATLSNTFVMDGQGRALQSRSSSSYLMMESSDGAVDASALVVPAPTKPTFQEKAWKAYLSTTDTLTTLFPLWTVLFAGIALLKPNTFAWFSTKYFTASLGTV